MMGQTQGRMKEVYSRIRNEALAFACMNLIEHWGSGIPRIIGRIKAAGIVWPEFIGGEVDLRINIYRNQMNGTQLLQHSVDGAESAGKLPENRRQTADNGTGTVNSQICTGEWFCYNHPGSRIIGD